MIRITDALAERLEMAEAADGAACAEAEWLLTPNSDAAIKAVGGGFAMYLGAASPLTHALGVGMHGPVTAADVEEIEEFFKTRAAPIIIDVCPHAHPSLREAVADRGYMINDWNNVLVRDLKPDASLPAQSSDAQVRAAGPLDIEEYSDTIARGFFGRQEVGPEERHLGRVLFSIPGGKAYLAYLGDQAAGGGSMSIRKNVASLFADATLPEFRRRGIHSAVILARLQAAMEAGCDIATASTQPGSQSQLNYHRLGFQVAYTKVTMSVA